MLTSWPLACRLRKPENWSVSLANHWRYTAFLLPAVCAFAHLVHILDDKSKFAHMSLASLLFGIAEIEWRLQVSPWAIQRFKLEIGLPIFLLVLRRVGICTTRHNPPLANKFDLAVIAPEIISFSRVLHHLIFQGQDADVVIKIDGILTFCQGRRIDLERIDDLLEQTFGYVRSSPFLQPHRVRIFADFAVDKVNQIMILPDLPALNLHLLAELAHP